MNIKKKIADIERQLEEVKAYLKKEERIYVPDSIKVLIDGAGIVHGSKQLHYSHSFNDWFVIRKPSDSLLMQRPYLEKVEKLEVGKVYFVKYFDKMRMESDRPIEISNLLYYAIYLGCSSFVYWSDSNVFQLDLITKDHDFYEVKDEA